MRDFPYIVQPNHQFLQFSATLKIHILLLLRAKLSIISLVITAYSKKKISASVRSNEYEGKVDGRTDRQTLMIAIPFGRIGRGVKITARSSLPD